MNKVNTDKVPSKTTDTPVGPSESAFDGRGDEEVCSNCHEVVNGNGSVRSVALLPPWLGGKPTPSNTAYLCPECYERYNGDDSSGGSPNPRPSDWDMRRRWCYERDGYNCVCCSRDVGDGGTLTPHAHHLVPVRNGGSHHISNTRTVCGDCHAFIHAHVLTPTLASEALYRLTYRYFGAANRAMLAIRKCSTFKTKLSHDPGTAEEALSRKRRWIELYHDCQRAVMEIETVSKRTDSVWVSPRVAHNFKWLLSQHQQLLIRYSGWLDSVRESVGVS